MGCGRNTAAHIQEINQEAKKLFWHMQISSPFSVILFFMTSWEFLCCKMPNITCPIQTVWDFKGAVPLRTDKMITVIPLNIYSVKDTCCGINGSYNQRLWFWSSAGLWSVSSIRKRRICLFVCMKHFILRCT